MKSYLWHRLTVSDVLWGIFGAIVVMALVSHMFLRSIVTNEQLSSVRMDSRLTVFKCWQWSEQYPPDAYRRCQDRSYASYEMR